MNDIITNEQRQILVGSLLGDGHLYLGIRCVNPYFAINRAAADKEYLMWEAEKLTPFLGDKGVSFFDVFDKRTQKTYRRISLRTRSDEVFLSLFREWYPKRRKVLPIKLNLTPMVVAIWFADDGWLSRRTSKLKNGDSCKVGHYEGGFATNDFSYKEVCRLKVLLENTIGSKFTIGKTKSQCNRGWVILFTTKTAIKFVNYIKDVFPPLKRKSDKWKNGVDLWRKLWYPRCIFCNSDKRHHVGKNRAMSDQFKCLSCGKYYRNYYKQLQGGVKTAKYINNLCQSTTQV